MKSAPVADNWNDVKMGAIVSAGGGGGGGGGEAEAGVVWLTAWIDVLPYASTASTYIVYAVPGARPVAVVVVAVPAATGDDPEIDVVDAAASPAMVTELPAARARMSAAVGVPEPVRVGSTTHVTVLASSRV